MLYAVNGNPVQVEARSEADGSLLWSWVPPQAAETGFVSEPLLTQNLVFVSTNLATYAIDLATHQAVWSYPLVGKLALSKSGIIAGNDGTRTHDMWCSPDGAQWREAAAVSVTL